MLLCNANNVECTLKRQEASSTNCCTQKKFKTCFSLSITNFIFAQVKNTVGTEKYEGNTAEVCEGKSSWDCAGSSTAVRLNLSGTSKFAGVKENTDTSRRWITGIIHKQSVSL